MKRFAFWFVLGLVAISVIKAKRESTHGPQVAESQLPSRLVAVYQTEGPKHDKRGNVLYKVVGDDHREMTLKQVRRRYRHTEIVEVDNPDEVRGEEAQHALIRVQDLPVPVIEGTVTTEANTEPIPQAPQQRIALIAPPELAATEATDDDEVETLVDEMGELKDKKVKPVTSVAGRISATEDRAKKDARVQLVGLIRSRLEGVVPRDWSIPDELVDAMIKKTDIKKSQREFGTYYEATFTLDPAKERIDDITAAYKHEQVAKRLTLLGGGLAFVVLCLGALSGYIKADEATKGYYTNPLRITAAAGVGAGGVLLYQIIVGKI